jgi:hypothetical protein
MYAGPLPTDRRAIAASLCQLLAEGAEDQSVSLEQLGNAARQIADFLLNDERRHAHSGTSPRLRVIEGGRT